MNWRFWKRYKKPTLILGSEKEGFRDLLAKPEDLTPKQKMTRLLQDMSDEEIEMIRKKPST